MYNLAHYDRLHTPEAPKHLQEGVNLAVYAANAEQLAVCLFSEADLQQGLVTNEVALDPVRNKTGDIWHVMLPQLDASSLYGKVHPLASMLASMATA